MASLETPGMWGRDPDSGFLACFVMLVHRVLLTAGMLSARPGLGALETSSLVSLA